MNGDPGMSATASGDRPISSSQTSGIVGHQWVSDLLRRVADADQSRLRIAATLAAADLRRICHWTEHRGTVRDKRTHHIVRQERERRRLVDPTGVPNPRQAPDAGQIPPRRRRAA